MNQYQNLGKPFQIGKLTIKNRFYMAPIYWCENKEWNKIEKKKIG